jgi:hypothetical protein
MAVFYSFHYERDSWRVQQVMQMGAIEGQTLLNSQAWEEIKRKGNKAVESWIDEQMKYKSAVVVLVGAKTDTRPWVRHELVNAWNGRRPLLGIRIHGLADRNGRTDVSGGNPFAKVTLPNGGSVADHVPLFSPGGVGSTSVHASIKQNLTTWVASGYKRP